MKIIYNNLIPFPGYLAITIFPFIFARKGNRELTNVDINHEKIHLYQQAETILSAFALILILVIAFGISPWYLLISYPTFYVWYGIEYIIRKIMYDNAKEGYRNISFEQEAYLHEGDLTYLTYRNLFSWIKYIKQKTYTKPKPLF